MKRDFKNSNYFKNLIASASKQFKNKFVALIPSAIPACTYKILALPKIKNFRQECRKNPSEFFSPIYTTI